MLLHGGFVNAPHYRRPFRDDVWYCFQTNPSEAVRCKVVLSIVFPSGSFVDTLVIDKRNDREGGKESSRMGIDIPSALRRPRFWASNIFKPSILGAVDVVCCLPGRSGSSSCREPPCCSMASWSYQTS